MNPNQFDLDVFLYRKLKKSSNDTFNYLKTEFAEIRYFDSGGQKPVLLTAPDGPCFLEHFSNFVSVAEKEWRVVLLDMPGFGESYPQNGYNHSFDSAVKVIKSLIDHLKLNDITLSLSCGNGFYGIYFSKEYPDLVKRLILTQTPGFEGMRPWLKASVPVPIKIPFVGQILVYAQRFKIPKIWFKVALPKDSPHRKPWSELSTKKIEENCCNCLASVVQGMTAMEENLLNGCDVPALMIWGKKDFSHRNTDEQSLKSILPKVEIVVWDDCGHFPELEHTERYLDLIKETF